MPLGINKKETVTLLLSYFIFLSSFCQSQYLVKGEVIGASDGTLLYSSVDTSKCFTYGRSTTVYDKNLYIVGDAGCVTIGSRWYIVMNDNDIFIAEKYFFHDNKKIDSLLSIIKQKTPNIEDRKRLAPAELNQIKVEENKQIEEEKQRAVLAERLQHQKDLKQADSVSKMLDEKLATLRIKNVVIWNWSWSYSNEYSSFADVDITVINPYRQKIKYIYFTLIAFNAVDDAVRDGIRGNTDKTVRGIGPIEYSDKGAYHFESVFYSKVIATMKIKQIKIQFFDGSIKIISKPVSLNVEDE